ncbi:MULTISPECIES: hypothetical protein [Nocardia]|uniref:hypothetical protein n=1 Tax=Nocardia TaxID=1817 RepID=UPI0024551094|nr:MULTISPECIES: hypothetical protein [Nocardia]
MSKKNAVAGVQASLCLDVWMALGLDVLLFDAYYQRNCFGTTWAELMSRVRALAIPPNPCFVEEWCALQAGHFGVCYAADDLGSGTPLPLPKEKS